MSRASVAVAVAALLVASCASEGSEAEPTEASVMPTTSDAPASPATVTTDLPSSSASTAVTPATNATPDQPSTSGADGPSSGESDIPEFDFSAASAIVGDFVDERRLNGAGLAIVHRDHGLIHHEHWGVFDEERVSLIASSSKMISAGVLLALQDRGLLDIDAPVADVVPWGSANPDITPAQLVSNSSGLVGLGPNPAYPPYLCQWVATTDLLTCGEQIFTSVEDDADIAAPDTEFRYGGAQWQVAGAVAEAASGMTWAELVEEIFVEPCGVGSLGYNNHFAQTGGGFVYPTAVDGDVAFLDSTTNPNIEGGAYITSGDYAELLLMLLRDGRCGDDQVLSADAVDTAVADRILDVYGGETGSATAGYGLGWWIDRQSGLRSDGGAYGSVPWLDLDDGYGVYLVIEADSATGNDLAGQLYDVIDEAVNAA